MSGRSLLLLVLLAAVAAAANEFEHERDALIAQLGEEGIQDPRVLSAMRAVPRHRFVPAGWRELAYRDTALPIGLGQTISQPSVVAMMTALLDPEPAARVLEIGTGSGYQAAVLSRLVRQVWTIELEPELASSAAMRLHELGYTNVIVRQGDGYKGWPDKAPFDRIILTAAPTEVPRTLLEQLRPGGKLVAPVGAGDQWIEVIEKASDGHITRRSVAPVMFVPMRHPPAR